MSAPDRKFLGRHSTIANRERVYETAEGLEIDSNQAYELARRRVLFSDILFVTFHKQIGVAYPLALSILAGWFLVFATCTASLAKNASAGASFLVIALPALALVIVRLVFKVDIVTVYGRRSKAVIAFPFYKAKARRTFAHIVDRTREVQEAATPAPPLSPVHQTWPPVEAL